MKKFLISLLSSAVLLSPITIFAQGNSEVAIGASNSSENVKFLLDLFQSQEKNYITIDGNIINEFLKDGSNASTSVLSSVAVEFKDSGKGVTVEILTPENITSVTEGAYQNAAITAGANNVNIKIASVTPVTGEGALAGVYKIFSNAGLELNSQNIANAENLIVLEQLLADQTNMRPSEISKFITEYNLALINGVEDKKNLKDSDVTEILNSIITNYNYKFSEQLTQKLLEHGVNFAKSDAAKDPETKKALETTLASIEEITQSYKQGNVEVTFNDMYLTEERNQFIDKNYDNILVIDYTVKNNSKDNDIPSDHLFTLYANNQLADGYFFDEFIGGLISPSREGRAVVSFGFNGNVKNLELELKDMTDFQAKPLIIKVPENLNYK